MSTLCMSEPESSGSSLQPRSEEGSHVLWYNMAVSTRLGRPLRCSVCLEPCNQGQGYISLSGRSSSYRSSWCLTIVPPAVEVAHFRQPHSVGMSFCGSCPWTLPVSVGTVPSQQTPGGVSEALLLLVVPKEPAAGLPPASSFSAQKYRTVFSNGAQF